MSTAVSRAARDLAKQMYPMSEGQGEEMARRIQSSLANLLEKARITVANARVVPDPEMQGATDTYSVPLDDIGDLAEALEPWKAEQITQKPEK